MLALAESAGLRDLGDEHLSVPTDKGANAGLKVASLVGGMVAGADSIDDMALLRHGGMGRVFARAYAPSTLGSFLRAFTFGHVRQLDAIASRFLIAVAGLTRLVGCSRAEPADRRSRHGSGIRVARCRRHHHRGPRSRQARRRIRLQRVRGLNALLATLTTAGAGPVIVAQRLRRGACGSPRGAKRLVGDAVKTARRLLGKTKLILVRMDSAFYGRGAVHAALAGGAAVSVTVRMDTAGQEGDRRDRRRCVDHDRVHRRRLRRGHRRAGSLGPRSPRSASPRSLPRRRPTTSRAGWWCGGSRTSTPRRAAGQDTLFDAWRFHAFFTTTDPEILDTIAADKTHRGHAVIEQVHADLKDSALAHLPSGVFTANAAWLVLAVIAFNLTRAAASLTDPRPGKATTATIRRKLIAVPTRSRPRPAGSPCTSPQPGPGRPPGHDRSPAASDDDVPAGQRQTAHLAHPARGQRGPHHDPPIAAHAASHVGHDDLDRDAEHPHDAVKRIGALPLLIEQRDGGSGEGDGKGDTGKTDPGADIEHRGVTAQTLPEGERVDDVAVPDPVGLRQGRSHPW